MRAQRLAALTFSGGELVAGLANAGVVLLGVWLGVGGHLSAGRLVAFLFLVTLFVGPVQVATETLNDAQNALAGLRRVLDMLDTEVEIVDPADPAIAVAASCRRAARRALRRVDYAYPGGPLVLRDVDLTCRPARGSPSSARPAAARRRWRS